MGFRNGAFLITISDHVSWRVDAALDSGEEKNFCGSGADALICAFQALFTSRACSTPFGVSSASGPRHEKDEQMDIPK